MKYRTILLVAVLISLSFAVAIGQNKSEEKFKLGQSYEKYGDYLNAQRLFLEVYEANKSNQKYFDALKRSYMALNQYSEFLVIVKERFDRFKSSEMYALYGELLWRTGQFEQANQIWTEVLDKQKNPQTFQDIAEAQIKLFLFEKAIETYKKARNDLDDASIFADEMSQLYIAIGDFNKGSSEVMTLFESTRNLAMAEGRLSAMMTSEEAIKYIHTILKEKYCNTGTGSHPEVDGQIHESRTDLALATVRLKE